MEKDNFTFFKSYYEAFKNLPPETVGNIIMAMGSYFFDGEEEEMDGMTKAVFELIRPILNQSRHISEVRSEASKGHGAPAGNSNASKTNKNKQKQTNENFDCFENKQKQTDKDKEKDKEKDKDIYIPPKPPQGLFEDPELDRVFGEYLTARREQGVPCDIQRIQRKLFDLAKGDKAKMILILEQSLTQGWKGLFALEEDKKARAPTNKLKNHEERSYNMSELERDLVAKAMSRGG